MKIQIFKNLWYASAYRTPSMKTRDARILDMISTYLCDGKSSMIVQKNC